MPKIYRKPQQYKTATYTTADKYTKYNQNIKNIAEACPRCKLNSINDTLITDKIPKASPKLDVSEGFFPTTQT